MEPYCYATISEISGLISSKKVSPLELVKMCLGRIEKYNPVVNAFITVTGEQAEHQARVAEKEINQGQWRGPLHGVPIGIKDFFDTEGIRTTAGSAHFKDRIPSKDAVAVSKLKEAGAIILGKTNRHELGDGNHVNSKLFWKRSQSLESGLCGVLDLARSVAGISMRQLTSSG